MQHKGRKITGWVFSGLVLAFMLFGAVMKFTPGYHDQFVQMAPGFAATPDWIFAIVIFIGVGLYIWPRTRVIGFALTTSYLGGAAALSWNAMGASAALGVLVPVVALWIGTALLHPSLLGEQE